MFKSPLVSFCIQVPSKMDIGWQNSCFNLLSAICFLGLVLLSFSKTNKNLLLLYDEVLIWDKPGIRNSNLLIIETVLLQCHQVSSFLRWEGEMNQGTGKVWHEN